MDSKSRQNGDEFENVEPEKKNVAIETRQREKRMLEYASNIMSFDWVREEGHEGCQRGQGLGGTGKQEKERDRENLGDLESRYRYANCSLRHSLRTGFNSSFEDVELNFREGVWDSRVRVQDFLTEDTGRGHSLGSEIEG